MAKSIEEQVEDQFKKTLDGMGVRHFGKTDNINSAIEGALKVAESKSGGKGDNRPDVKLLLECPGCRNIPVMIEAKGLKGKLEKRDPKTGEIVLVTYYNKDGKPGKDGKLTHLAGDENRSAVTGFAVNGAVHYANAILAGGDYDEAIAVGVNGTKLGSDGDVEDLEVKAYYISRKNNSVPKLIKGIDGKDLSLFKNSNLGELCRRLDELTLSDEEIEELTKKTEVTLEARIKSIHQNLYDDERMRTVLTTNEKLYMFCGLIMAGLDAEGVEPLTSRMLWGRDSETNNDGTVIADQIEDFLKAKGCSVGKIEMIMGLLRPVFEKKAIWQPHNGESAAKWLFSQVKSEIVPCLESNLHLDFTGKILNSINDWVSIENDKQNDVVLTPRYVTKFMAQLARTDKDSRVWDLAMGSGGFLVSAIDIMIKDAQATITDQEELKAKIEHIKEKQIFGVEILGNIYILAVLNMILMGDVSSNIINGDSHEQYADCNFPANVFLLNPPYSAPGKGFVFVEEALSQMTEGYAAILIQENAGSGNGLPYTKRILENNTLLASIHMADLFCGKAGVQTAIYVFQVARPHEADDLVTFVDFSEDGYTRMNRRKSSQEVNLRDTDHAKERYAEVLARVLGKKAKTEYYTEDNGKLIRDTIGLSGDDWTFQQHYKLDLQPALDDFRCTVADYLAWRVSEAIKGSE